MIHVCRVKPQWGFKFEKGYIGKILQKSSSQKPIGKRSCVKATLVSIDSSLSKS